MNTELSKEMISIMQNFHFEFLKSDSITIFSLLTILFFFPSIWVFWKLFPIEIRKKYSWFFVPFIKIYVLSPFIAFLLLLLQFILFGPTPLLTKIFKWIFLIGFFPFLWLMLRSIIYLYNERLYKKKLQVNIKKFETFQGDLIELNVYTNPLKIRFFLEDISNNDFIKNFEDEKIWNDNAIKNLRKSLNNLSEIHLSQRLKTIISLSFRVNNYYNVKIDYAMVNMFFFYIAKNAVFEEDKDRKQFIDVLNDIRALSPLDEDLFKGEKNPFL